jgi:hypothetical protein
MGHCPLTGLTGQRGFSINIIKHKTELAKTEASWQI